MAAPSPTPTPSDPHDAGHADVFHIGDNVHFADLDITYTDVEVLDYVETVDGGTIAAEDGESLVLLSSEFTNPGPETVDLSCSGVHRAYIQMFDTDENEIAPEFETSELPGNPECNQQLLVGQESEWNTLWRMTDGATPGYLTIADTDTWDTIAIVLDESITVTID